jgi:hypothetical protein
VNINNQHERYAALFSAVHRAQKLCPYGAAERVLINRNCSLGAEWLHMAMLPAPENAIRITRTPVNPEFNALSLTYVLFSFDNLNHYGTINQ